MARLEFGIRRHGLVMWCFSRIDDKSDWSDDSLSPTYQAFQVLSIKGILTSLLMLTYDCSQIAFEQPNELRQTLRNGILQPRLVGILLLSHELARHSIAGVNI